MEPRASSPAGRVESNRRPSYGHARGAPSSVGNGVLEHLLLYCTYSSLRHYYSRALSRQSLINLAPAPSDVVPPAQFCPSQGHQRTASSSSLSQLDREGRSHKSSSPAHLPILSTHNAVVDVLFGQAQTRYSTGSWRAGGCCLDAPSACTSGPGAHGGQHLAWTSSPPTAVPPYRTYRTAMYLTRGNAGRAGWAVLSTGRAALLPTPLLPSWYFGEALFYSSAGPGLVDGATAQGNGATRAPNYAGAAGSS
jgi:hypothetical protein